MCSSTNSGPGSPRDKPAKRLASHGNSSLPPARPDASCMRLRVPSPKHDAPGRSTATRRLRALACSACALLASPCLAAPLWLEDGTPPEPAPGLLEQMIEGSELAARIGPVPGWVSLVLLALLPAIATLVIWLWWCRRVASSPETRTADVLAWRLHLTASERRVVDRLAQCARTGGAAVLLVRHTYERALAALPDATSDDRRTRALAERLGARLFPGMNRGHAAS